MNLEILKYMPTKIGSSFVATPIDVAKKSLDIIDDSDPQIWTNPDLKVLDIACKTGTFLYAAYNKLMVGLENIIPDERDRAKHIIDNQLYAITFNKVSLPVIKDLLYGSWEDEHTNIVYTNIILNSKSGREHLKELIQKEFSGMTFDVIVGNPPYQEMDGGGGDNTKSAMPLYHIFINNALELNPRYISMIIPSRWMSGGKSVLDTFRANMINGKHIKSIYNYEKASDIFEGVKIAGGVQYLLYDRDYVGDTEVHNCYKDSEDIVDTRDIGKYTYVDKITKKDTYMILSNNHSAKIADNVLKISGNRMDTTVLSRTPFGLSSSYSDSLLDTEEKNIHVICSKGRDTWTGMDSIPQNQNVVGKWKVSVATVTDTNGLVDKTGKRLVISKPFILKPNEVCSESYLVLGTHNTEQEALNMLEYIKTNFVRFLLFCTFSSMHITARNFMFVPVQDYSKPWTDTELYTKYNLTADEINFIESKIRPME